MNIDIVFFYFDSLPPPPKEDIQIKNILLSFLTPSLLPKIRTSKYLFVVPETKLFITKPQSEKILNKYTKMDKKGQKGLFLLFWGAKHFLMNIKGIFA